MERRNNIWDKKRQVRDKFDSSSSEESFEKKFSNKEYHNRLDKGKVICSIPLNKLHLDHIVKINNHIKEADYLKEKSKRKRTSQRSSDSCDSLKTKAAVAKILDTNHANEKDKNFNLHINKDSSKNSYSSSSGSESSSEKIVTKSDKKLKSFHEKERVNEFQNKENAILFKHQKTRSQANEDAYYSDSASSCSSQSTLILPSIKSNLENFDELPMSIEPKLMACSNSVEPSIDNELTIRKTFYPFDEENSLSTKFDSREKNKQKIQHFLKNVATAQADEATSLRGRGNQHKSTRCSSTSSSSSESRSESSYSSTSSSSGSSISRDSSTKSASAAKSSHSSSSSYVEKRSKYSVKAQKHTYLRSPFKEPRKEAQVRKKIHIGHLTKNTNKKHLIEIFGLFGNIKNIDLPLDRYHSNINRGFCYVEYERSSDAERAIFHMNSGEIDGNRITVSPVIPLRHRWIRRPPPSSIRRGRYMPWRKSPHYRRYADSRRRNRSPFRRRGHSPVRSVPRRDCFSRRSSSSSC